MKGLIIVGSAKVGSHTAALAKYLKGQFEDHEFDVEIFDLSIVQFINLMFQGLLNHQKHIKQT